MLNKQKMKGPNLAPLDAECREEEFLKSAMPKIKIVEG